MMLEYKEDNIKMMTCLKIFATQEPACWETVVLAVCESPFYNQKLAKTIATNNKVSWSPFEHVCGVILL